MRPKRNPRYANGHRRRQLRAAVLAEEDNCGLCGRPVAKDLPAGLPDSAEVDEIVPVSLGGNPFDRANARLAHRLCNQRRGNGLRHQQRRMVPPFITTARPADEGIGAASPPGGDGTAHSGRSAFHTEGNNPDG